MNTEIKTFTNQEFYGMLKLGIITYKYVQRTYNVEEKSQNRKHKCTVLIFRNKEFTKKIGFEH